MGFFSEFKEFAMRGNVVDLAVGLIIGAEFGKIVNSAVNDIIMPPIGKALGGTEFSNLRLSLGKSAAVENLEEAVTAKAELTDGVAEADIPTVEATAEWIDADIKEKAAQEMIEKFGTDISINYGKFIQNVFNFLVIAFAVFIVVRIMNSLEKKEDEAPVPPPRDEQLLAEIRDLLADKKS